MGQANGTQNSNRYQPYNYATQRVSVLHIEFYINLCFYF